MNKVRLKVLPSLAETLGMEETSEETSLDQGIEGSNSILNLLNRLGAKYQGFGQIVFDASTQKLTGKVAIFLNGRTLEAESGLNTELKDGDTLTFVPVIEGG